MYLSFNVNMFYGFVSNVERVGLFSIFLEVQAVISEVFLTDQKYLLSKTDTHSPK